MPPQRKRRQNRAVNKKVIDKKTVKQRRNSYSIEQKRQVITYAKENGIIKAAKFFDFDKGGTTTLGNLRRARLSDVCGWVKRAWKEIPDEMVIESFKTCRISTSLDGSDDEITDNEDSDVGSDIDCDSNYE